MLISAMGTVSFEVNGSSLLMWSLEGEKKRSQETATERLCLHLKWKDFTVIT